MSLDLETALPSPFVGVFLAITAALITVLSYKEWRRTPPGPMGLPFLGYLPFVTDKPHIKFHQLRKKYGGLFSLYLGNRYAVVLNDFESIKDAWSQDACLGRPSATSFDLSAHAISLNDVNGPSWKENRRLTVRILKDLGFDKQEMEERVKDELKEFIKALEETHGEDYDIHRRLTSSISNNITGLVFGERLEFSDPRRRMLDDYFEIITGFFKQISIHSSFPWLKRFLVQLKILNYNNMDRNFVNFMDLINDEVDRHKATMETNRVRDYIDGYVQNLEKPDPSPYLSKRFLRGNIRSLFGAGTDSVRTTCEWCLLAVAHYTDHQKRIQQELDAVVGRGRDPSLSDQKNTPLTMATIYETFRWIGVQPLTLQRMALEDTTIHGQFIPKGTMLLMNMWSVHHDEKLWTDPFVFLPSRFINKIGELTKFEYFIPFGKGKRNCPGEHMALIELYLYFATVIHRFHVLPPKEKPVNFESRLGVTLQPITAELRFIPHQ